MHLHIPPPQGVTTLSVRQSPSGILWLDLLEVEPGKRGAGVGSRVLADLKKRGRTIRLQAVADTDKDQPKLERFYQRNGFVKIDFPIPNTFEWAP